MGQDAFVGCWLAGLFCRGTTCVFATEWQQNYDKMRKGIVWVGEKCRLFALCRVQSRPVYAVLT